MNAMHHARGLSAAILTVVLLGCAAGTPVDPDRREQVRENFDVLQRELARRDWSRIERFFSPQYMGPGGYVELRNHIEDRNQTERLVQIQFIVNRVMERDGLLNVQVRWNKSFLDKAGKPQKGSGVSEVTLRPVGDSFQILGIRGASFL